MWPSQTLVLYKITLSSSFSLKIQRQSSNKSKQVKAALGKDLGLLTRIYSRQNPQRI